MGNINKEANLWVRQVILELKNEYRELIYPISMMQIKESDKEILKDGFATDGEAVYYHPEYIFEQRKSTLKLQLLHIILHGLLGHFERKDEYDNKEYRDFMMDIQVECVLRRMECKYFKSEEYQWNKLNQYVEGDYSMDIYRRMCEEEIPTWGIAYYYQMLQVDDHRMWDEGKKNQQNRMHFNLWGDVREALCEKTQWADFQEDTMNGVAGFLAGKGGTAGGSTFEVGRGKVNYKQLLEEIICVKETDKEDADSIDFMMYQYGMELYENVPLIEPREEAVSEGDVMIVLAVDVSGSCIDHEQMKLFWGETYECMSRLKEYSSDIEVLLIQCDDSIRKEQIIHLQELSENPKELMVYGGGGTSFIPVFDRIKELERVGKKIGALLYLTDGVGVYPEEKPDYPVYFILEEETELYFKRPDWIHTVKL